MPENDEIWMKIALAEAKKAATQGEVPVGAVVVLNDSIVAKGRNQKENLPSGIGHAELIALHRASLRLERWRLSDCTLYTTLEPCVMCAGALIQSRIGRLVFGAKDSKLGAITSKLQLSSGMGFNHEFPFTEGVLEQPCAHILKSFFKRRRQENEINDGQ